MNIIEDVVMPSKLIVEMVIPVIATTTEWRTTLLLGHLSISTNSYSLPSPLKSMLSTIASNSNHLHPSTPDVPMPPTHISKTLQSFQILKPSSELILRNLRIIPISKQPPIPLPLPPPLLDDHKLSKHQ